MSRHPGRTDRLRRTRRPGRLTRLFAAAGVTLSLALGGLAAGAAPAAADPLPMDQCTTTSGVVLAVDFSRWGGPLLRSCGTTPTTGYTLLNQGGWKTTGTGHDGPAFICRIGYSGHQGGKQYPPPEQEKCVKTPPATAYWSYWHADPGQNSWSYSQLGAMSYKPLPGSVDLWIFGATNIEGTEGRPTMSPDSLRAHNTTPGGGSQPSTPPAGGGSTGGSGGGTTTGGGSTGGSTTGGGTNGGSGNGSSGGGGSSGSTGSGSTGGTATTGGTKGTSGGSGTTGGKATPPGSTTGAPRPSAPAPDAPRPTDQPAESATPGAAPQDTATPAPSTDAPSTGPAPSPTESPAPATGLTPVDAAPVADAPHDAGSIAPAVTGIALVVALGVATTVAALRRRRRRQAE
ncbi:hypothetical protein ACIRBX_24065 [Kitasatospora sp. NPDC096147]|uniref:hypothetical protein n=1 Tax=Kitasatospora sp. NPDC096147 TaxID=3364093 RepID=UPI003813A559